MKQYNLYIGLNDKDTRVQSIPTSVALDHVYALAWELFDGVTVTTGHGVYTHDDGEKIVENTVIVTVCDYDDSKADAVRTFAERAKAIFNQESIMITAQELTVCDLI